MYNPWFALAYDAAWLGFEVQRVVALRLIRLAAGGAFGNAEAQRMVSEKVAAYLEAQIVAATELAQGQPEAAVRKAIRVYTRRVVANRRRLSRDGG